MVALISDSDVIIGGGANSGHVFVFPRVGAILKHVYKNKHMERALLDFFYIKTPFSKFKFSKKCLF